jgi:hypothetical protein
VPEWREEKERLRWLIKEGKLTDDMKVKIVIPSLDARSRMENREKKKRVCWNTDEHNYSEFAAIREAWLTQVLEHNPTLFGHAVVEAMRTFDIKGWAEGQDATEQKG